MRRLILLSLVVILGIEAGGFAWNPACFVKTPESYFVGEIKINFNEGTLQFKVYQWSYVYIFGYNLFLGTWEAIRPRVSSEVKHYPPGYHTICIGNGKIRQLESLVLIATQRPCFVYPHPPISRAPLASEISIGDCGRSDVVKIKLHHMCCLSAQRRVDYSFYSFCCPPCPLLFFLIFLAMSN